MSIEGTRLLLAEAERKRRELPDASFAFQTRRVGRVMSRYFNGHLRDAVGLHATQIDVLAAVKAIPNASLKTLANRLGTAECTVSRSLKRLVGKGLVERRTPRDRRRRFPKLTECGEAALRSGKELLEKIPQPYIVSRFGKEISSGLRARCEKLTRLIKDQRAEEHFVKHFVPLYERWRYYWRWEGMTEEAAFWRWRAEGYHPHRPPTPKPDD